MGCSVNLAQFLVKNKRLKNLHCTFQMKITTLVGESVRAFFPTISITRLGKLGENPVNKMRKFGPKLVPEIDTHVLLIHVSYLIDLKYVI